MRLKQIVKHPFEVNKLWEYKFNCYLGSYDSVSSVKRVAAYRLGWALFEKNNISRHDFRRFHVSLIRHIRWYRFLIYFYAILVITPVVLFAPGHWVFKLVISAITLGAAYTFDRSVFNKKDRRNHRHTTFFFDFLEKEAEHWKLFLEIDHRKPDSAQKLHDLCFFGRRQKQPEPPVDLLDLWVGNDRSEKEKQFEKIMCYYTNPDQTDTPFFRKTEAGKYQLVRLVRAQAVSRTIAAFLLTLLNKGWIDLSKWITINAPARYQAISSKIEFDKFSHQNLEDARIEQYNTEPAFKRYLKEFDHIPQNTQ